ncbi:hypothetical protein BDV96DRAFT_682188 [Lophiotrema nucula]|uniref:Uncharacterized protein n=1 Tax=Lophiotrema nucula TaxID=690887 RepID=A0A6A5ZR99_9PLEO|nr:hypothetical protein BDV96DRAFT_682188 [Lophiotrema nucula]
MRFNITLLALAAAVVASPTTRSTTSQLHELAIQTINSDQCKLPDPGTNCAGATMKDVIVEYPKNVSADTASLILGAVKTSGGNVVHDWNTFGFSAFVPDQVLNLVKTYGATIGVNVHENACAEIPWCGEAPC